MQECLILDAVSEQRRDSWAHSSILGMLPAPCPGPTPKPGTPAWGAQSQGPEHPPCRRLPPQRMG